MTNYEKIIAEIENENENEKFDPDAPQREDEQLIKVRGMYGQPVYMTQSEIDSSVSAQETAEALLSRFED